MQHAQIERVGAIRKKQRQAALRLDTLSREIDKYEIALSACHREKQDVLSDIHSMASSIAGLQHPEVISTLASPSSSILHLPVSAECQVASADSSLNGSDLGVDRAIKRARPSSRSASSGLQPHELKSMFRHVTGLDWTSRII
jgi:hypothetical protein